MFSVGSFLRHRVTGQGSFDCPVCQRRTSYQLERHVRHAHLYFVPLYEVECLDERVRCAECDTLFRPQLLYTTNADLPATHNVTDEVGGPMYRRVVTFTKNAELEIHRRLVDNNFPYGTAVRVDSSEQEPQSIRILIDTIEAGSGDWLDQWGELRILVAPAIAESLAGKTIDFDGKFLCTQSTHENTSAAD